MKAIKAIFENGSVALTEAPPEKGPVEVLVVFPDGETDPWEQILNEPTPRPAFAKLVEEVMRDIEAGNTEPLDLAKCKCPEPESS